MSVTHRGAAAIKFASYTGAQCEFAIRDIHATLAICKVGGDQDYQDKLYAELDAARDRLRQLATVRSRAGAVDLAHELAAVLRDAAPTLSSTNLRRATEALAKYQAWSGT